MKLYRICTENVNYEHIIELVADYFAGFTVVKAEGFWQGKSEHSLIIEIMTDDAQGVEDVAWHIRKANNQETVLVQVLDCEARFVGALKNGGDDLYGV